MIIEVKVKRANSPYPSFLLYLKIIKNGAEIRVNRTYDAKMDIHGRHILVSNIKFLAKNHICHMQLGQSWPLFRFQILESGWFVNKVMNE